MSRATAQSTETRQSLLPKTPSSSPRKDMQKNETQSSSISDLQADAEYSDKFRKFSRAFFDEADDCDSIELDFNSNSKGGKHNKKRVLKSVHKTPQVCLRTVKLFFNFFFFA